MNLIVPLGTLISAMSPNDLPNKPLPIGELIESFPADKSASPSATKVYYISMPFDLFLILTLDKTNTLELSN